jgi:hypothetical protein
VSVLPVATDTSLTQLAKLLAALEFAEKTLKRPGFRQDEFRCNNRGASVRLTTASGDAYRVTVEWLSEDSP